MKEPKKIAIIVSIIVIIALVGILITRIMIDKNKIENSKAQIQNLKLEQSKQEKEEIKEEKKETKIYNGTDRPIAVMIDNHKGAWPQAGLNKTYLVYEIIVEGGETRLMALFKGKNVDVVGPVRSSRHYFLDYVMENDALYAHYGWSPKAQSDISTLGINNINGIYYGKPTFWRITNKRAPHNAMTSTEQILSAAKKKGYRTESDISSILNYSQDEINLDAGKKAENINIKHSYLHSVSYKFDKKTKKYNRYARGTLQKDYTTGKTITTKNLIVMFAKSSVLDDGTDKDRQELHNIGTFKGYYITNGKAIKIECIKSSRNSRTIYREADSGKEIEVNDGNTWINICPSSENLTIEQ